MGSVVIVVVEESVAPYGPRRAVRRLRVGRGGRPVAVVVSADDGFSALASCKVPSGTPADTRYGFCGLASHLTPLNEHGKMDACSRHQPCRWQDPPPPVEATSCRVARGGPPR